MRKYDFAFGSLDEAPADDSMKVYEIPEQDIYVLSREPVSTDEIAEQKMSTLFQTASTFAEGSLDRTFDKVSSLASSQEVQQFLSDNGLTPYLKDVNRDRVKNILAVMGMIYAGKLLKSKIGLALIAGVGLYLVGQNRDKVTEVVAKKITSQS